MRRTVAEAPISSWPSDGTGKALEMGWIDDLRFVIFEVRSF
jgi:hypothetical protein